MPTEFPPSFIDDQRRDIDVHMRLAVDGLPSMLAYWDKDLRCRFANKAYKTWFGLSPEKIIGVPMEDLLGPRLFTLNRPYVLGALAGKEQIFERVVPGPDGVQRYSLAHYIPDVADGEVRGFAVQVTEITYVKEIEAALRASEAFLDRTGRIARVGGWEVDLRTNVVTWSDQTCRIFGMPPGYHPTREEARQFIAPEERDRWITKATESEKQGGTWTGEMPVITAQGKRIWVRATGEVVMEDGRAVKLMGAIQDITQEVLSRKELAREHALRLQLEQQTTELNALLVERSDMLDVLAHEVRQPLNNASAALQSAAQALAGAGVPGVSHRLERAQGVMNQVMANVDNTLAVAALLARSGSISPEDTDIDTLIAVVEADMPASERARIVIQRLTSTRTAAMDMSLMRLALRNLLANALKFSPTDRPVTIRISDSDAPLALVIEVADSGPGIPEKVLSRLFERGAHGGGLQNQSGHGLGLYIVRRVMELHGGQVELTCNSTRGATMRLTISQAAVNGARNT